MNGHAGILLIPAILCVTLLNHGPVMLLKSSLIMVTFQGVIAAPFLLNGTDVSVYLHRSGLIGSGNGGIQLRPAFYGYLTAPKQESLFWTWISDEKYYDENGLATHCAHAFLLVNVWFFFIRNRNHAAACLHNIVSTLKGDRQEIKAPSFSQMRHTCEILLIQYVSGAAVMPGATLAVQNWFMVVVPMLLGMIGLPSLGTFWMTHVLYPIN